ncbi:MAG: multicopper oxidase domain-containing protein [Terriglobales bacterium]
MRSLFRCLLAMLICGCSFCEIVAQASCPKRPTPGSVVQDALSLIPQNGVLAAKFIMGHSVDQYGYTHFCYNYKDSDGQYVEAPTLRVHQGDTLILGVEDRIQDVDAGMKMPAPAGKACGDGGPRTLEATNVHFHGMNVSPNCHQDDVLTTLIQPGTPGLEYKIPIPTDEPPGLYWYHPHVHGFAEFQVNGGAAGALVVEGMEQVHPEVAGLTQRVFTIRQQYLVPWIPGPYQLSINFQVSALPFPQPKIQMAPGEKQFWRVANATIQDFLPLQFQINGVAQPMELIALDGYPVSQPKMETTILVPPAGRAEFVVQAPASGQLAQFVTLNYSTGPTGNPDLPQSLASVQLTNNPEGGYKEPAAKSTGPAIHLQNLKFADLANQKATAVRKLYFSEEFGGTNGPIQFYITVDGQQQRVFEPNEKPVITTKVGAVEDWTIENRALETHAFHIHQIHFLVLEIDGKPVPHQYYLDTIAIPFWEGPGHPYHSVKVRMDFRDPTIAGTFVFHCHILLHEDLGMMHKILVEP